MMTAEEVVRSTNRYLIAHPGNWNGRTNFVRYWSNQLDLKRWRKDHPGEEPRFIIYPAADFGLGHYRIFGSWAALEDFVLSPETLTCTCGLCKMLTKVIMEQPLQPS